MRKVSGANLVVGVVAGCVSRLIDLSFFSTFARERPPKLTLLTSSVRVAGHQALDLAHLERFVRVDGAPAQVGRVVVPAAAAQRLQLAVAHEHALALVPAEVGGQLMVSLGPAHGEATHQQRRTAFVGFIGAWPLSRASSALICIRYGSPFNGRHHEICRPRTMIAR